MYRFSKYQGLGNDFILFDSTQAHPDILDRLTPEKIEPLCRTKYGIGGDGIIILTRSSQADFGMRLFNADGSEAELSGNGLRCLALFIRDEKLSSKRRMEIKTGGGINPVELLADNTVRVGMPRPEFRREHIPMTGNGDCIDMKLKFTGETFIATALAVGNPHCVLFGDFTLDEVLRLGPVIENSAYFPSRVNAEFASIADNGSIELTVFERGVGVTDACGTGATAAACAAIKTGRLDFETPIIVRQKGGDLEITASKNFTEIYLTGKAERVFTGEISL